MTLVPPSRLGPPDSPKQVPPLFEWSLRNSSLIELLLATRVVAAKKRVAEFAERLLAVRIARAAAVDEVLHAVAHQRRPACSSAGYRPARRSGAPRTDRRSRGGGDDVGSGFVLAP